MAETMTNDPLLQPMTMEEAEFALAGVGNVMPFTDEKVERIMAKVMAMVKAGDN